LVVEPALAMVGPSLAPGALIPDHELDAQVMAIHQGHIDEAVTMLGRDGWTVEGAVILGRPGTILVDEVLRFRPDLTIVGSRGHGAIASLVLGSVSSEVIDHVPCPVLVARTPAITKLLFATDGSEPSAAAGEVLASWPIFEGIEIRVLSVADVVAPWQTGIAPTMHARVTQAYAKDLEFARAEHARIASDAAARLRAAGRSVETKSRDGDAAAEIITDAEESAFDLVVIGSRGRTGVARLLLGSVARNVLHGSRVSVLVVHKP
jgi:nucleotide-binding universal stress UspA family protein